ncbi:TPA: hypothetical protein ACR6NM_005202, partial [Klebsiella pneumoniae]
DESVNHDQISLYADEFGAILHRLRIPTYFRQGLQLLTNNPELLIERGDDVNNIRQYVMLTTSTLQAEAA